MPAAVPVWVPPLFLVLVAVGWRQARPRSVRPGVLAAVAVTMLGLSAAGVVGVFGATPLALAAWAAGAVAVVVLAAPRVDTAALAVDGPAVQLPGSWTPLALMLGIFAVRFALGIAAGVHAAALGQVWLVALASVALGALSGAFAARALAVHRFAAGVGARARAARPA